MPDSCPTNNNINNTKINKRASKKKVSSWEPTEADFEYAASKGLDAADVLEGIRLWDKQNGNKAAYADLTAFWQGWCRREAKRAPRASNGQQSSSKPTGKKLSEKQEALVESLIDQAYRRYAQGDRLLAGEDFHEMRRQLQEACLAGNLKEAADRYTLRL